MYVTQFETGGGVLVLVGVIALVGVLLLAAEIRGTRVGTGVTLWLGIESGGIEVGKVRDCCVRLLLSESLTMPLGGKGAVVTFPDAHAASNTNRETDSRLQQVFFLKQ